VKVLIACEYTGIVRDCFLAMGHEAMSCDIIDTEVEGPHYKGDVRDVLEDGWDLMIAHPPCTYLCSSGLHWNKRMPERELKTVEALNFIKDLWEAPINRICLENPVGCINTRLKFMPKPQYIQPYYFGEDASKKTGLWLKNLPELKDTEYIEPRIVVKNNKEYKRWSNQTDSGQNAMPPSKTRGQDRSRTYFGIASAMALQWDF